MFLANVKSTLKQNVNLEKEEAAVERESKWSSSSKSFTLSALLFLAYNATTHDKGSFAQGS